MGIVSGNEGAVRCCTSAGFVVEGVLRGQLHVEGDPRDRICIGCFNPKDVPQG